MARCVQAIQRTRPVAFIPVDYPGFNMRLAARVRSRRLPVVWYIAPQLWAWGEGRAADLAAVVDRLLVVFPFEVEFFARHGITADHVGHPLMETILHEPARTRDRSSVLLMPGSRRQEVHHHVPILARTIEHCLLDDPSIHVRVARARNIDVRSLEPLVRMGATLVDDAAEAMATSGAGLVKAGTSTLEAALRGLPFATFYRTSALSYQVSKRLVNVSSITMMNLLLRRNVVHEYIQSGATPENLAAEVRALLTDDARRAELAAATDEVRTLLAGEGASARAAEIVAEVVRR
jgi:lipid-A-disaccharide synthase